MIIAIRSEMDSRPVLYPLIRVLNNYGTVCVISSNRQVRRLIEDEDDQGFRNIRVYVDEDGAVDAVYEEYGITKDDFTFIILDNMGAMEYDVLIVPVGEVVSEEFQDEVDLLKTDTSCRFLNFGKVVKKPRTTKSAKSTSAPKPARVSARDRHKAKDQVEDVNVVDEVDDDPAARFRHEEDIDEQYNVAERSYSVKYITYQEIEDMESKYILPKPGPELGNAFYDIFKDKFAVDKRTYEKDIRKDDNQRHATPRRVTADTESEPRRTKGRR